MNKPRPYDFLLFDLDGTICDPLRGVSGCINYALRSCGFDTVTDARIAGFIGPPLDTAFEEFSGTDSVEVVDALVRKYRERYSDVGYTECYLYPGMEETLTDLARRGVPLGICTSKRSDFARRIVEMLGLVDLFRFIDGGDVRIPKARQIERLRAVGEIPPRSIMIGDRAVDLIAAHANALPAAGVLWGYGSRGELEAETPAYLVGSPPELLQLADATFV